LTLAERVKLLILQRGIGSKQPVISEAPESIEGGKTRNWHREGERKDTRGRNLPGRRNRFVNKKLDWKGKELKVHGKSFVISALYSIRIS
jgi:hypothetical protein